MALIVRKLKDSVDVSDGGGKSPPRKPGQSTGGGGSSAIRASIIATAQREADKKAAEKQAAKNQKQFRDAQVKKQRATISAYNRQLKADEKLRRKGKNVENISTGVFSEGGAVVQKTTGDFASLQRLNEQRPGSVLVQTKDGKYVLVEGRGGLNLSKKGTFDKYNANLALEGRGLFFSIGEKNAAGGIDYKRNISDSIGVSGGIGGFVESETKSRPAQPREIAQMITDKDIKPQFIGEQSVKVMSQNKIAGSQQKVRSPINITGQTYVDSRGKDIVTITGQSKGSNFGIYQKINEVKSFPSTNKASVLNFLEAKSEPKSKTVLDYAKESYVNIGVDIASSVFVGGVPQYTKKPEEKLLSYRKESQVDLVLQPDRWGEINPKSPAFIGSVGAYASTFVLGGWKTPVRKPSVKPTGKTQFDNIKPGQNQYRTDVFKQDTAIYGYGSTKVKLGSAKDLNTRLLTKKPVLSQDNMLVPGRDFIKTKISLGSAALKTIPAYTSKTKLAMGEGKVIRPGKDFTSNKLSLGQGWGAVTPKATGIRPPKLNPNDIAIPGRDFIKSSVSLGRGVVASKMKPTPRTLKSKLDSDNIVSTSGRDFVRYSVGLGYGAIRTPPRKITSSLNRPVKSDPTYQVSDKPVELQPFENTRINLGRGAGSLKRANSIQSPNKDFVKRISKPPLKDVSQTSSPGLVLIMKEPLQKFKSTKVSLGESKQTLQMRDGKTIQNSIQKVKPSSSSFSTQQKPMMKGSATIMVEDVMAFPPGTPMSKTGIKTGTIQGQKLTQGLKTSLIQTTKPLQTVQPKQSQRLKTTPRYRLASPMSPKQPQKITQTPIQKIPTKQKQIIEEIPPKIPPKIIITGAFATRIKKKRLPKKKVNLKRVNFLGATNLETVEGWRTRKTDLTYGKSVPRIAAKNISLTRSNIGKGVSIF